MFKTYHHCAAVNLLSVLYHRISFYSLSINIESNKLLTNIYLKDKKMKKLIALLMLLSLQSIQIMAQESHLYSKNIALFYPANYDREAMEPSFAIIRDLSKGSELPDSWRVRPHFSKVNGKNHITISVDRGTDLYGCGEVLGDLRRNGTDTYLWNSDNYTYAKWQGKQLYQSHPWVLALRSDGSAFGVLFDNTYRQHISLKGDIEVSCEGPAPRVVVIEGEKVDDVVKQLSYLTGTIELPPLWALGYQQARFSYFPLSRVKEVADEFRSRRIPCDVIWMDIDYMDKRKVFTFDPVNFNDPKGLNDYLHSKNFKAIYMVDPGICRDSTYNIYRSGSVIDAWIKDSVGGEAKGKVWPGECVFPDFTNPRTAEWWSGLNSEFVKLGIDGIWNDMNEPAVFNSEMTLPKSSVHSGGLMVNGKPLPAGTHARYHNVYGMLMLDATRKGMLMTNPDKRLFILSRANFLGGQRLGATWTGDNASTWDYLRCSIPMTLNLGLSGQPFTGPDTGGFSGDCNGDLLANWTALSAYFPFFRNHSADNTVSQEPWAFDSKTEDICRTAINRRYILLPYLSTLFRQSSIDGMPVMRPLYFYDSKDSALRTEQEAFLLGGDLLVIPRWAGECALPKGDWDIVPFEKEDDGVQPYVALRPGAAVPVGNVMQSTEEYATDSLTILVNPDNRGVAEGIYYDDITGKTFPIKAKVSGSKIKVTIEKGGELNRIIRVAVVSNGKAEYSPWSQNSKVVIKWSGDDELSLKRDALKFQERKFEQKSLNFMLNRNHESDGIDLY